VIPIELDWIPGYLAETSYQSQAIRSLIEEIESLPRVLKTMGFGNVEVVIKDRKETLSEWAEKFMREGDDLSNIAALASETTVSFLNKRYKINSIDNEKRPFLASINPVELRKFYEIEGESLDNQLYIKIMAMLSIMFELAVGKNAPQLPDDFPIAVKYTEDDKKNKMVFFLPKVKRMKYDDLINYYNSKKLVHHSA